MTSIDTDPQIGEQSQPVEVIAPHEVAGQAEIRQLYLELNQVVNLAVAIGARDTIGEFRRLNGHTVDGLSSATLAYYGGGNKPSPNKPFTYLRVDRKVFADPKEGSLTATFVFGKPGFAANWEASKRTYAITKAAGEYTAEHREWHGGILRHSTEAVDRIIDNPNWQDEAVTLEPTNHQTTELMNIISDCVLSMPSNQNSESNAPQAERSFIRRVLGKIGLAR